MVISLELGNFIYLSFPLYKTERLRMWSIYITRLLSVLSKKCGAPKTEWPSNVVLLY